MRLINVMLIAWLASACTAPKTDQTPMPMAMVEIEIEEVENTAPDKVAEEKAQPALPVLTYEEFEYLFLREASCYEFKIPTSVLQGSGDQVQATRYKPCMMKGFEQVMRGQPEVFITNHLLVLKPIGQGIYPIKFGMSLELDPDRYYPRLCVEPTLVGGTFPPTMRCADLSFTPSTSTYSLIEPSLWYLIFRQQSDGKDTKSP